MNIKRSRIMTALGLALVAGTLVAPQEAVSQAVEVSSTSANWDIFRSGGDNIEKGDALFDAGKYEEALDAYSKALAAFQKLRTSDPNWNRSVVNYRITMSQSKVSSAERKVSEAKAAAPGRRVVIDGDVFAPFRAVVQALDACAMQGLEVAGIHTAEGIPDRD